MGTYTDDYMDKEFYNIISGVDIKLLYDKNREYWDFFMNLLPKNFLFYKEPFFHQLLTIVYGLQFHDGLGIFHDMGAGKTACAINILRAKDIRNGILVITVNAALQNWKNEFEIHAGKEYKVKIISGCINSKNELLKEDADVYVINYEGIFKRINGMTPNEKRNCTAEKYTLEGLNRKWNSFIIDESRMVKSISAIRTKVCMYLSNIAKYKMILTGMPIAKSIGEIFTQQYCVDLGRQFGINHSIFTTRYFAKIQKYGGRFFEYAPREGAEKEIRRRMYMQGIRFSKEECLDLPEKIYQTREVVLEGDQKSFYNTLVKDKTNWIISNKNKLEVRDLLIKFMQITGGFLKVEGEIKKFGQNAKMKELLSILQDELPGEKIVVIATFVAEQNGIYEFLKFHGFKVYKIVSGMNSIEIDTVIKEFSLSGGIIVMSPRVGGRAINLVSCHYPIYYSQDFDYEINKQVEDRFHRIGQKNNVTYIKLIAKETVDEKVVNVLTSNKNLFDVIVEGKNLSELI
jgi:SNF2 family DNA or RNA helicase